GPRLRACAPPACPPTQRTGRRDGKDSATLGGNPLELAGLGLKCLWPPADESKAQPVLGMTWRAPRTLHRKAGRSRRRSRGQKLLVTAAVLGATASIAGLGTFATFTSSTSASHTVASGTVTIGLGAAGSANRLSVDATAIAPGDTIQRAVDVINQGTLDMASVTLTTQATTS